MCVCPGGVLLCLLALRVRVCRGVFVCACRTSSRFQEHSVDDSALALPSLIVTPSDAARSSARKYARTLLALGGITYEGCFGECAQYDAILFWKIGPLFLLTRQLFGSKTCDARNASLSCSALQTVSEVLDDVSAIPARHFCRARSCAGTIMWIISRNITP